jgi:hypothetical protein
MMSDDPEDNHEEVGESLIIRLRQPNPNTGERGGLDREHVAKMLAPRYLLPEWYFVQFLELCNDNIGDMVRTLNTFAPYSWYPSIAVFRDIYNTVEAAKLAVKKES